MGTAFFCAITQQVVAIPFQYSLLNSPEGTVLIIFGTFFVGAITFVNFVEIKRTDPYVLLIAYYKIVV